MAFLQNLSPKQSGVAIPVSERKTTLGRHPACEVLLDDQRVSRRHAQIIRQGPDSFVLIDLESRNGTNLNGKRVTHPTMLNDGDVISIEDVKLAFRQEDPSPMIDRPSEITGTMAVSRASSISFGANPEVKLRAVLEISTQLSRSLSLDQILESMLDSLFRVFPQADRAIVLLPDAGAEPRIRCCRTRRADDESAVKISRMVIDQVMREATGILSVDATDDIRFQTSESLFNASIRSLMCAPLLSAEGECLGVVQVDRRTLGAPFVQEDLELLVAVATITGQAVDNNQLHVDRMKAELVEQELQIAAEVQRMLVSETRPEVSGYELATFYQPAIELSGDYLDCVPLKGGRVAIAIGDVAGKGVAASLLMAQLQAAVRLCFEETDNPAKVLERCNNLICRTSNMRFITCLIGVLDPKRHTLRIACAGHCPALIGCGDSLMPVPSDKQPAATPIGILDDFSCPILEVQLKPGDLVFLNTDGLTEWGDGQRNLFGQERLEQALRGNIASAQGAIDAAITAAKQFAGPRATSDDLTMIALRRM
jgi:phosphoserine phosphatase RsbU/P